MRTPQPQDHPEIKPAKTGVLLVNLGTPEATDYWSMRTYLKEFLSDPRVIETNRALWWLILNLVILTIRPKKSGHAYAQIWNREKNESPLKTFTRAQSDKLAARFTGQETVMVDWAMRYGQPPIKQRLENLKQQGCERILVVPLYPQYSATTTASVFDKVADAMRTMRWQPALRYVPPFFDDDTYIKALAKRSNDHLASLDFEPEKIIISYHGLPKSYLEKGDPYHCQCLKTTRLLTKHLNANPDNVISAFQSRVGRQEWLRPYTDETVVELAKSGTRNIMVISPAFISDCVETLEELSIALKDDFLSAGGQNFSVAPCLNASEVSIDMLEKITTNELAGWL